MLREIVKKPSDATKKRGNAVTGRANRIRQIIPQGKLRSYCT